MKKSRALQNIVYSSKLYLKQHSSTILTCISAVGVIATSLLTAKTTIKVFEIVNEEECEMKRDLTKKELVAVAAPVYIPAIIMGASTIACIFGANILNKKQKALLSSAYMLANNSFKEYKNKLKELYGEKTHNKIIDSIVAEKTKDVHISANYLFSECDSSLENDDSEPMLFYDEYSGQYFETTTERVLSAEYHLNRNYILKGYATLNEFYGFLGLEPTEYGEILGWSPMDKSMYWIEFNHRKVILGDDLQCFILEMPFEPRAEYLDDY